MNLEAAIEAIKSMPEFCLGQTVETPDGTGVIVHMNMDYNGLYIRPETARCTVWFSMDDAFKRWSSMSYSLTELKEYNK